MKEIKLTQGKVALVDDEDFKWLNQHNWYILNGTYTEYAVREVNNKCLIMHRLIMKTPNNLIVDHKNHNGLDNQKHNMRNVTKGQNNQHRINHKINASVYKGISINRNTGKWVVRISIDNERLCLGSFEVEEQAALIYNLAALKYHGEFAYLNMLPKEYEQQFKEVTEILNVK